MHPQLDAQDDLAGFREEFYIPRIEGNEQLYFCGNSLGLQPKSTQAAIQQELDDWAALGVEGHFHAKHPWMPYHGELRESAGRERRRQADRSGGDEFADRQSASADGQFLSAERRTAVPS